MLKRRQRKTLKRHQRKTLKRHQRKTLKRRQSKTLKRRRQQRRITRKKVKKGGKPPATVIPPKAGEIPTTVVDADEDFLEMNMDEINLHREIGITQEMLSNTPQQKKIIPVYSNMEKLIENIKKNPLTPINDNELPNICVYLSDEDQTIDDNLRKLLIDKLQTGIYQLIQNGNKIETIAVLKKKIDPKNKKRETNPELQNKLKMRLYFSILAQNYLTIIADENESPENIAITKKKLDTLFPNYAMVVELETCYEKYKNKYLPDCFGDDTDEFNNLTPHGKMDNAKNCTNVYLNEIDKKQNCIDEEELSFLEKQINTYANDNAEIKDNFKLLKRLNIQNCEINERNKDPREERENQKVLSNREANEEVNVIGFKQIENPEIYKQINWNDADITIIKKIYDKLRNVDIPDKDTPYPPANAMIEEIENNKDFLNKMPPGIKTKFDKIVERIKTA